MAWHKSFIPTRRPSFKVPTSLRAIQQKKKPKAIVIVYFIDKRSVRPVTRAFVTIKFVPPRTCPPNQSTAVNNRTLSITIILNPNIYKTNKNYQWKHDFKIGLKKTPFFYDAHEPNDSLLIGQLFVVVPYSKWFEHQSLGIQSKCNYRKERTCLTPAALFE